MIEETTEILSPAECAARIAEICGTKLEPETAAELWPKISQHKWLLSEKLSRDVGLRVACIDFLENMDQAQAEYLAFEQAGLLDEMGARAISKELWETIS